MKICVPSSNRESITTTQLFYKDCVFFVPYSQIDNYKYYLSQEIIGVPDDVKGITKTRNYILKYFPNENIVFIDDDTKQAGYFLNNKRISFKNSNYESILNAEFNRIFELCYDLGFKIWGAEQSGSLYANHELTPFAFKGVINGSFLGIINDGEFLFDENFEVKEDYEIVLRHYLKKGGILKCNTFHWSTHHWSNKGGCVDYRTDELESQAINLLKRRYPFRIKPSKTKNKHQISIRWD
jgi:hypothetical protein